MIAIMRTAGMSLLALGYAVQHATAADVDTCDALKAAVEDASGPITITISGFSCATTITIASGQEITIDANEKTITVAEAFVGSDTVDGYSVFVNEGTLTLENVNFNEENAPVDSEGVRAVHNKGTLTVTNCDFTKLNQRTTPTLNGGAILTETDGGEVTISSAAFTSNVAYQSGGAICANGTDVLTVTDTIFTGNEVESGATADTGRGGSIYAATGVDLKVVSSNFTGGSASYAGSAIWCCGAELIDCFFNNLETSLSTGNYGAVTSNLPGGGSCPFSLKVTRCQFYGCAASGGKGGALAIFDTSASLVDTMIQHSVGTGLVFESSSATGEDQLTMEVVQFNYNTDGSSEFATSDGVGQATAMVVYNSGVSNGDLVQMGDFNGVWCFANNPYECEIVYHQSDIVHNGEFKCNICNLDGEKQAPDEDDDLGQADRAVDSGTSAESQGIIIGLSLALAFTLLIIGALAAYKMRVRKNARRLMEDMGDGDL